MNLLLPTKAFQKDPDHFRALFARRGPQVVETFDKILALDKARRSLLPEIEQMRAEQNKLSKTVAKQKTLLQAEKITEIEFEKSLDATKQIAQSIKNLNSKLKIVEEEFWYYQLRLPNLPAEAAPDQDTVLVQVGDQEIDGLHLRKKENIAFAAATTALDHAALAADNIDMQAGAQLAGSRFAYLKGDLVLLQLALVQWVVNKLVTNGFNPVIPPVLAKEEALYGTGFLPDTEQQIYHVAHDDLYLTGTSEVALASLHKNQTLALQDLPLRYAGISSCFRREAGSAGKDTTGIFRVHQFDKVEMFSFCSPEKAKQEHALLLGIEKEILSDLGLPYRVVNIAVDDLGPSATQKFDCEVWIPSQNQYRELTSTSNTTDFQTRRLGIKLEGEQKYAYTLNGTAVAVGRTLVALLEHGQQADGSIVIPNCLQAFGAPSLITNNQKEPY